MSPKERPDGDGELERYCSICHEWWPADQEFFYHWVDKDGLLHFHSWCKACYQEYKRKRYQRKKKMKGGIQYVTN